MATYALYVLVIMIVNNFYNELNSPLDVLRLFFRIWGNFDWDNNIITILAPIKTPNFYEKLKFEVFLSSF
jgi:hypothetical protein